MRVAIQIGERPLQTGRRIYRQDDIVQAGGDNTDRRTTIQIRGRPNTNWKAVHTDSRVVYTDRRATMQTGGRQ
jgi:hypothetical protein